MPLRTLTRFRNPDLTSDLNHRLRNLVNKGVFFGGQVLPVAGTLDVSVPNFAAMGADGMVTLLEGAAETLTCTPGVSQWVLLRAYYVANDAAVAELEVLGATAYDALSTIEQQQRVKLALVTLGPTATEVTTADISFVAADQIDPVIRSPFRGAVDAETDLPDWTDPATGVTTQNRAGDIYFVNDERLFYSWSVTGTPQWAPVISAAEEVALRNHKDNQDDGTEPPDFFDAVHVQVKHRESLDEGSASVKQHAANGTDFGTGNAFVDEALPTSVLYRDDVTGLASATQFQLTGTYYVGTGAIGTANAHFGLAVYQQAKALLGTDRNPITVLQVRRSDDTFELAPSGDADPLGYYTDPIIVMNFGATTDSNFTGNLSAYGRLKRTAGTIQPGDEALDDVGLGFIRPSQDVPVVGANFTAISTGTDDVQEALDLIDGVLTTLTGVSSGVDGTVKKIVDLVSLAGGPDPDELNWYGGTSSAIGTLTIYGTDPVVETATGLDLQFRVPSASEAFRWYSDTSVLAAWANTELLFYRDFRLLRDDAVIKIQAGITGTEGGIEWNFNNPSVVYGSIKLDYDARSTDGLQLYSAYPISYDATTYHRWDNGGTQHMYLSSSGELGIGTSFSAPQTLLHVYTGNANIAPYASTLLTLEAGASAGFISLLSDAVAADRNQGVLFGANTTTGPDADRGWLIYTHTDDRLGDVMSIGVNAAHRIYIKRDGTMGIGVGFTAPESLLHLEQNSMGQSPAAGSVLTVENDANTYVQLLGGNASGEYCGVLFGDVSAADVGRIRYRHDIDRLEFWTASTERMVVLNNGRVGIGPGFETPDSLLHVNGSDTGLTPIGNTLLTLEYDNQSGYISILAQDVGGIVFGDDGDTDAGAIRYDHNNTLSLGYGNDVMVFYTAGTERMLIDGAGDVAVGLTDPNSRLHVYAASSGYDPIANTVVTVESSSAAYISFMVPYQDAGLVVNTGSDTDAGQFLYRPGIANPGWSWSVESSEIMTLDGTDGLVVGDTVQAVTFKTGSKVIPFHCMNGDATSANTTDQKLLSSAGRRILGTAASSLYQNINLPTAGTVTAVGITLQGAASHNYSVTLYRVDETTRSRTTMASASATANLSSATDVALTVTSGSFDSSDIIYLAVTNNNTATALDIFPGTVTATLDDVTNAKAT